MHSTVKEKQSEADPFNCASQSQDNKAKGWSRDNRGSLPVVVFDSKGNGNGTSADSQDQSSFSQAQDSTINGGNNVSLTSTEGDIKATGASIAAGQALTDDTVILVVSVQIRLKPRIADGNQLSTKSW